MPKAFISYSWDNPSHKAWVKHFATRLDSDGIEITLDQWACAPGDQLPAFMEQAVRENDFVLIVCTPEYKAKYNNRDRSAGYEGDIIQGEVLVKKNYRKFIPILRRGVWEEVAPSALLGTYYIDLRHGLAHNNYRELVATLKGARPQGPSPGSADENEPIEYTIVLDGTCDESVMPRVETILAHLRILLGDSSLTIQRIQPGSIILRLKGSKAGFRHMKNLFDSGQVRSLGGFGLLYVAGPPFADDRSHKRAVASLPFRLEWDQGDKHCTANAITVDVSHSGCRAVVKADLPLRRQVRIVMLKTGRSATAEVVWRGHEAWDVGIALQDPDPGFWGVKI